MSGWDWLHAGLEVATYAQARKAQQNVNSLQTAIQSAAEIEAARRALIEAMRNFIFDISRDLQRAEEHISDFPMQVFIVAKSAEVRLKDSGLTPAVFPEFSDKEYVDNTHRKISSVLSASGANLTEEQLEQAELAVKCLVEMPLLQDAVMAKSSLEQLQASESEWKELEGSKNSSKTKRTFGLLGLAFGLCLCSISSLGSGNEVSGGVVLGVITLLGAVLLIAGSNPNIPRHNELKAQREALQKNLLPVDTWNLVTARFGGDLPSEQYKKLLEDRIAFLNPILGNEFQNYLTEG